MSDAVTAGSDGAPQTPPPMDTAKHDAIEESGRHLDRDPEKYRAWLESQGPTAPNEDPEKVKYQSPRAVEIAEFGEPIPTREILPALIAGIRRHVAMPDHAALLAALWVLHTHVFAAFSTSPRLIIRSAHPACGKSLLLSVLSFLVPQPLMICGGTQRALLERLSFVPTLLIDDSALALHNRTIATILRSGRQRTGPGILTTHQDRTQTVGLFTPAALTIDGKTPPLLAGRAIELRMIPAKPDDVIEPLHDGNLDALLAVRSMAVDWATEHSTDLHDANNTRPLASDDIWTPLLLIAADAGEEWESKARELVARSRAETGLPLHLLLGDIRELLQQVRSGDIAIHGPNGASRSDNDRIRSGDLARLLAGLEGQPWNEWGRTASAITTHGLAVLLADANVRPCSLRFNWLDQGGQAKSTAEKGYMFAHLEDAIARYASAPAGL